MKKHIWLVAGLVMAADVRPVYACTLAGPPVCAPVLGARYSQQGAKLPSNARGLFVRHEPMSPNAENGSATPPTDFYTLRTSPADGQEWSMSIQPAGTELYQRAPAFVALLPDGGTLGTPGAREAVVPVCNFNGGTSGLTEATSTVKFELTEAAPLPTTAAPLLSQAKFSVRPKGDGANCGGPTEEISAQVELTLAEDMRPWLDVLLWTRAEYARTPESLLPYYEGNVNSDHTGITLYRSYPCSKVARDEVWTLKAALPGVAETEQPAAATLKLQIPACSAVPTNGSSLSEIDPETGRVSASALATGGVGGGGCSAAFRTQRPSGAWVLGGALVVFMQKRRRRARS